MYLAAGWKDYELLDSGDGMKLERWKDIILLRPDPQVIWNTPRRHPMWKQAHARYHRSNTGGGQWERYRPIPDSWQIAYGDLQFALKPMGFKHTGLFPEQAVNWDLMAGLIKKENRPVKVLNLFGYTGAATVAAAKAGASVCHVDAARGMVAWARENAKSSGLENAPIRWIVDDCIKFVEREAAAYDEEAVYLEELREEYQNIDFLVINKTSGFYISNFTEEAEIEVKPIEENSLTDSYYDLLASEARQASLVAIAKKDVQPKHWNNLSRTLTVLKKYKGLISWSGTAFEYLMPNINIPKYQGSFSNKKHLDFINEIIYNILV